MRVIIARTMPIFSMDVYADGLITGLKKVRPEWEIVEAKPYFYNQKKRFLLAEFWNYYERSLHYPYKVMKQHADIFHVIDHSYGHLVYWLKRTGKPVIVTCHDLVNFTYPENLYSEARLPAISMAAWKFAVQGMKKADHTIAVSYHTIKDAVKILNMELDHLTVVPDAVDLSFHPLPQEEVEFFRQKHGISLETICLLNVGSVIPRKNILTILRVLETLKNQGLAVRLLKVGSNFTVEQQTFIRNYGLENFVTYLGQLDSHSLVQVYNAANVFLSPSLYEGFGMTVLEAMACGTPVITSNVSSLPEVAGDAAILVEPMDVQAMVEGVRNLQNDPAYRKSLIDKGLARVKLFTWERTAEQIAEVYEKVIEQRRKERVDAS